MISLILGRSGADNATLTRFSQIAPSVGNTPASLDATVRNVMGGTGTLSNWYLSRASAPGAGTSVAYTLVKNGVATAMSITISNTATIGSDTTNSVSYVPGDTFSIQLTPTGTVATAAAMYSFENSGTGQQLITGESNASATGAASYMGLQSSLSLSAATTAPIPTAGVISSLYMEASVAPGAAKSYTATLVVNGVDTSMVAVISGGSSTTANDTTHTVSVSAGDLAYWRIDPAGTPVAARLRIGAVFTPTIDGESIQLFSSTASLAATNNYSITGTVSTAYATTETTRASYTGSAFDVKKLYASLGTAPGVGKSFTFTIRSNATNTAVTVPITDASTSGTDLINTSALSVGLISVGIVGAGTPTLGTAQWGFVTYRAPVVAGSASNQYFTMMGVG